MLRKVVPISICLAALILGCEKKEPQREPPVVTVTPSLRAPAGMVPVREGVAVFITVEPVRVASYVQYLAETEQPVPARWQGLAPDSPDAGESITGLSRNEAERLAAWDLKRLPTAEEWQAAGAIVGARTYPWSEEGTAVPGAEIFLVRDWQIGTDAEMAARRAKAQLKETILADWNAQVDTLRGQLAQVVQVQQGHRTDEWRQFKRG